MFTSTLLEDSILVSTVVEEKLIVSKLGALESLLPVKELEMCNFGGGVCSSTSLDDNEGSGELFGLDDYGRSLQPAMTPELEEKINQSVSDAYNKNIKK